MRAVTLIFLMILLSLMSAGSSFSDQSIKNNTNISFQAARLIAVAEFNHKTGDVYKVFKCTLAEETSKDWRFVFDEFDNPPSPGALIFVFVDKATGKARVSWGR